VPPIRFRFEAPTPYLQASPSGGHSTTRITVPLSGGGSPIGLSAASFWNENPSGEESVIHRLAAKNPCSVEQAIWLEA
jgi:hypothetical protein